MIDTLENLPENIVGFRAWGEVTEEDFEYTVIPQVNQLVHKTGKLNYILVLDTSLENYTWRAWLKEAGMGLRNFFKWNRAAILSDNAATRKFVDDFSKIMFGRFRSFKREELQVAIDWASGSKI